MLPRRDWDRLLGLARRSDEIDVRIEPSDVSPTSLVKLAEEGGAFGFSDGAGADVRYPGP